MDNTLPGQNLRLHGAGRRIGGARIIGERFWIYASKGKGRAEGRGHAGTGGIWSRELAAHAAPPPWIVELANAMRLFPHELPTGVIVGSAVIERVTQKDGFYEWHLADARRVKTPREPSGHPQPVWFAPFSRRGTEARRLNLQSQPADQQLALEHHFFRQVPG